MRSFFSREVVRAHDGQKSAGFIMFGDKSSIQIGPIVVVAAVKLTFIFFKHFKSANMLRFLYDSDSSRGAELA